MINCDIAAKNEIYDVVSERIIQSLINSVNIRLKDGWFCQGGICIIKYNNDCKEFYQTMIKS